jgi:hypothetical protein
MLVATRTINAGGAATIAAAQTLLVPLGAGPPAQHATG